MVLFRALLVFLVLSLTSCRGMPKLAVTPVSVESSIGGEHQTQEDEDNVVKVETGDSSNIHYVTDTVDQVYNDIQQYPIWLVWAFACAVGMALPSPIAAWSGWRRRKDHSRKNRELIDVLTNELNKTNPQDNSDTEKR